MTIAGAIFLVGFLAALFVGLWAALAAAYRRNPGGAASQHDERLSGLEPVGVLGLDEQELGLYAEAWAAMLCDGASWVIRRKEALTLIDTTTLRRKTSIDFTVPAPLATTGAVCAELRAGGVRKGANSVLVPLLFLEKAPAMFTRFDFADEDRSSLPLPTRNENGMVSAFILIAAAERIVGHPLSRRLRGDLTGLAVLAPSEAEAYYNRVLGDVALTERERQHRAPLRADATFVWLAETLAYSSVVVVAVESTSPAVRHIVKLAFDQRVDNRRELPWLSAARFLAFGWEPLAIVVESPFIGAESYHFEAEVAPSIEILDAYLMTSFKNDFVELNRVIARAPRVHAYISDAAEGQTSVAKITFRVQRETFLIGALVASGLITATTAICVGFAGHLAANSSSFAGLLAAFPSLVVGYVLRGTGHDVATRLVWKARAVLFVAGLTPLIVGGRLAADRVSDTYAPNKWSLLDWWIPSLVVAGLATLALLFAVVFPRAPRRTAGLIDRFKIEPTDDHDAVH